MPFALAHASSVPTLGSLALGYFDGLQYLQKTLKEHLVSTCVLYDGDQEHVQDFDAYCSYRSLPELLK